MCIRDRHSVEQALAVNPGNPEAYNNGGAILHAMGQLDDAAACYRRALELAPGYADALCNLARLCLSRLDFEQALQCCSTAVSLDPGLAQAYGLRADALRGLNRNGEARQDSAHADALQRQRVAAYRKLGGQLQHCLLYTSPSPRDRTRSRMPSSA